MKALTIVGCLLSGAGDGQAHFGDGLAQLTLACVQERADFCGAEHAS